MFHKYLHPLLCKDFMLFFILKPKIRSKLGVPLVVLDIVFFSAGCVTLAAWVYSAGLKVQIFFWNMKIADLGYIFCTFFHIDVSWHYINNWFYLTDKIICRHTTVIFKFCGHRNSYSGPDLAWGPRVWHMYFIISENILHLYNILWL